MSKCNYTKEELQEAVKKSFSIAQVCREVGIRPVGGNYKTLKEKFKEYEIDTSHFTGQGWNVGLKFIPKPPKQLSEILVEHSTYLNSNNLRQRLIKEGIKEYKCECCGASEWMGNPISLELHHINGDNTDNRLENLQLLCANCHSQTDNFRTKNKVSKASEIRLQRYKEAIELKEKGLLEETSKNKIIKDKSKKQIKPKKMLICPICGKEFHPKGEQKYCSVECYNQAKGYDSNRPSVIQLIKDFQELGSFVQVGKKYEVTDNTIRKWCQLYQLPFHTKELKEYIENFNNPDYIPIKSEIKPRKTLDHQKIISDYKSGLSTKETANLNNCDESSVRNILNKYNIERHKRFKSIGQYNGETLIKIFENSKEAANWIIENNLSKAKYDTIQGAINKCCNRGRNLAYGYDWKYIE